MKKYVVFIISFALLLLVFQIISGMILTYTYTPDLSGAPEYQGEETAFGRTSLIPWLEGLLAATLAYYISRRVRKN